MTYQAWEHAVQVWETNGRWTVAVDRAASPKWYMSKAEAWEAGVREADRLERDAARHSFAGPGGMELATAH